MTLAGGQRSYRKPSLSLGVQYAVSARGLPVPSTVRRWAAAAQERDVRATIRFVAQAEARRLNAEFRSKDYATNVLTFVYDDVADRRHGRGAFPLAGDIVLCVPVLRREARAAGRPLRAHCAHLVVHGMLHLQGYDHEDDGDAALMERREREVLASLGYADPYRDRDA
jgi:probable rRNA maturation factor